MGAPKAGRSRPRKLMAGPRKPSKNAINRVQSTPLTAQLEDDVPDFPRGGRGSLGKRKGDDTDDAKGEFRKVERNGKKMKSMRRKTEGEEDTGSLFGEALTGKLPRFANKITLKNISPGMKVWGVIIEVNEKDLAVSLPGGLRGLVRSNETLDPFGEYKQDSDGDPCCMLHVGKLVSCIVIGLDNDKNKKAKPKIWLSLRLSALHKGFTIDVLQEGMVLTAYVKSIEDHGYILHFGVPCFSGFCPKHSQSENKEVKVVVGQLLQGSITRIDKSHRVVYLTTEHHTVSKCVPKDVKGISVDHLLPGMMVNAQIRGILEDGVMLSFLTYFTGTVDVFHLQNVFPSAKWKDEFPQNKMVIARILFVDPSTRAVGMTLNPYLLLQNAPPSYIKVGDIFDRSKVVRVDRRSGILLEIPSTPAPTPAYVNISDITDGEIPKLGKNFKEGVEVCARVIGCRHLEGLAMGSLKASLLEGSFITSSDVKPGMVVKAKVISVHNFGALVQFPSGIKALCPVPHMSELEIVKPRKKFKVGAEFVFRVLGCKAKRLTVTHKKTLVKSKLKIISSHADASDGLVTHGWIAKIDDHGCFVRFYNGVQGFVPRSELGLDPGCATSSVYHVGQVVKCRVTGSCPALRRINLSFSMRPSRISGHGVVKLGSIVSGEVEQVTSQIVIVHVGETSDLKGIIYTEHLSDHHGQALLMKSLLKPGYKFDQLLVLDVEGKNLKLTAKNSLLKSVEQLPEEISQIIPNTVVFGYICNLITSGCFVRFKNKLTAFCPRTKAVDYKKADITEFFYIGQSVCTTILNVDSQSGRILATLKDTCCYSADSSFIQGYFLQERKLTALQLSSLCDTEPLWDDDFTIGKVINGKIHEAKDFGVVIKFEEYNDIFGFITHHQLGGVTVNEGSIVRAAILDISRSERLLDLSLKPEFVDSWKEQNLDKKMHKKRKPGRSEKLEVQQTVNAKVELVKENYLVLSLPEHGYTVGFASICDYNTQKHPRKQFTNGHIVSASVVALSSPSSTGRLLLLLKSTSWKTGTFDINRSKKKLKYSVGSLVEAEIVEIKPLELKVKFGADIVGRVHISEVNDDAVEDPFGKLRVGESITARIIVKTARMMRLKKHCTWELSTRCTVISGSEDSVMKAGNADFNFFPGQRVVCYVYKVGPEWVWLTVKINVKARLFVLESSCEPSELQQFQQRFVVGKTVVGHVLHTDADKRILDITLRPLHMENGGQLIQCTPTASDGTCDISTTRPTHIHEGDILGGRISRVLPGIAGLAVRIASHLYGRVHFTELVDEYVADPLAGYLEGQFVKCKILEICHTNKGTIHIDLSLRPSLFGEDDNQDLLSAKKSFQNIEDLHPDHAVQGYVKSVTSKGCFILLSRKLDAKVLLCNLSDGFVENPEDEFPVGKLVTGRVLSVEPLSNRVEVTLKSGASVSPDPDLESFDKLHTGDYVSGRIKRVETFGLFIVIDHTSLVGLCHISKLPDDHIENISSKYKAGERVRALVLQVDKERRRISLGMKNSYICENATAGSALPSSSEDLIHWNVDTPAVIVERVIDDAIIEEDQCIIPAEIESRGSVLPLEVSLDEMYEEDQ